MTITERAVTELGKLLENLPEPRPRLRVFIDHRCHCGNVRFSMALDDSVQPDDQAFDVEGVPVVADPDAAAEIDAVKIDYVQDWMQQGFTIENLNHQCGGHG